jgi:hypothetical protein
MLNLLTPFPNRIPILAIIYRLLHRHYCLVSQSLVLKHCIPTLELFKLVKDIFRIRTECKFFQSSALGVGVEEPDRQDFDQDRGDVHDEIFPACTVHADGVYEVGEESGASPEELLD